jgi:RHS repeat-associated protein
MQDVSIINAGRISVGARAPSSKSWSLAAVSIQPTSRAATRTTRALLTANDTMIQRTFTYNTEGDAISTNGALLTANDATTTGRTFTYNAEGDRTSVTATGSTTINLSYDQANRLTSVSGGISYSYDGDSLRSSKTVNGTTTQFAWDEADSLPLLLQDGSTYYIYGPDGQPIEQITGSTPTYPLADQQGSTRLLTDNNGNVVGTYAYDAWGNVTNHTGTASTNLQYDGQYTDPETGYQYLRARYYDATSGQFLTDDPLVSLTGEAYAYASNSPADLSDALGLTDWWHVAKVVGAGADAVTLIAAGAVAGCVTTACTADVAALVVGVSAVGSSVGIAEDVRDCSAGSGSCKGDLACAVFSSAPGFVGGAIGLGCDVNGLEGGDYETKGSTCVGADNQKGTTLLRVIRSSDFDSTRH